MDRITRQALEILLTSQASVLEQLISQAKGLCQCHTVTHTKIEALSRALLVAMTMDDHEERKKFISGIMKICDPTESSKAVGRQIAQAESTADHVAAEIRSLIERIKNLPLSD